MNEADTCRKLIEPALAVAGWTPDHIREQQQITDGRVIPLSRLTYRRGSKLIPDYLLDYRPNYPIAVVEAKAEDIPASQGLQQAKAYAEILDLKFAYATNGHEIVEFDYLTGTQQVVDTYPSPDELWQRLRGDKQLVIEKDAADVLTPYHEEVDGKTPRYYQEIAINRTVEAVIRGQQRILLTMATGTGKTFTAFQIVWRLWKAKRKRRILFLADRNVLVDQAKDLTFAPLGEAAVKISGRAVKSREVYFGIYQQLVGHDGRPDLFRSYPPDFFDLIIVDECHRGSARDDSNWRVILEYFSSATQIGLTATPKREDNRNTYRYFGEAIYTYSLRKGIEDGFLAPYRLLRVLPSSDAFGVQIQDGERDRFGRSIPPGLYQSRDFERLLSVLSRTRAVARHLTNYLNRTDPYAKTIVFCVDQPHALQMRDALAELNADKLRVHSDYVARVVSDEGKFGRMALDKFKDPEQESPVILTSSQMLTTGVDAPTVQNIVLFRAIGNMTEFKQIIGRGTRLSLDNGKFHFNIIDYTGATQLFWDEAFDGFPVQSEITGMDEDGADWPIETPPVEADEPLALGETPGKYYIDGPTVTIMGQQEFALDPESNTLSTVSFTEQVGETVRRLSPDADHLLAIWPKTAQREEIVAALAERGITLEQLVEQTQRPDADPLDLLLHAAYNAPLLTRRERSEKLKQQKANFFNTYEPAAREILNALLDKYADFGILQLDDVRRTMQVPPFSDMGSILEIAQFFGGALAMKSAIDEMKQLLYTDSLQTDRAKNE